MNWYSGSISDAVVEAKSHNKVFLVYIEGDDDLSKQMTATYNNPMVTEKLASQSCVALKLSANSLSHQQFSEIYPVLVVPSSFFIGRNGIPLEILTGSLEAKDLCAKLDKVFELHSEEGKPVSSSQSNSPQSENASPAATASSLSEGSSLAAAAPVAPKDPAVDKKVQSEQESKNSPVGASAASESTTVASSASNTAAPVESSPSVVSVEDVGQSPSTSQENSASSSSEALPPLEDRVERAKALLEERRILKEMEENEKEKKEELERRKVGKAVQQAQHNRQEAELKEWALNRAKEKEEERVARERVRAQIAQDRAERAAKFQQEKARELETLKEKENAALRAEQEKGDRDAALRSTVAHLQFRLPNGSSVTHQFSADCTLEDARQFVLQEVRPSCGYFTLCTTFPRRHFSENNYAETLRDLQLAPTATLLILPASATIPREGGLLNFLLWTLLTPFLVVWRMITSWFRGSTTVGHGSPPAAAATAAPPPQQPRAPAQPGVSDGQQPSTSSKNPNQNRPPNSEKQSSQRRDQSFYRQDGNIFRLSGQQNDDDDNNTWNGNSTQQM